MESTEKKKKRKKKKKNSRSTTIAIVVLIVAGLLVMLYPTISNVYNEMTGSYAIQQFNRTLEDRTEEELAAERMKAEAYNAAVLENMDKIECEYEYDDIMDFGGGMMGYLEIPVIDVYLPIYHSVDEDVLTKGVGHIPKTSLPIGGEGNHSVLSGHTGLPSAELLTDLIDMQEGDVFYLHILEETLAYEVDQILVVLPEEVDNLLPVAGEDYCTLVTCTPYGINSHRLLVRGHRIEYTEEVAVAVEDTGLDTGWIIAGVVVVLILLSTLGFGIRLVLKRKKKGDKAAKDTDSVADRKTSKDVTERK